MRKIKGIDVSAAQGIIDFEKVRADGVQFVIIRCGYGQDIKKQDDKHFIRNVKACERVGLPWGAYLFSYADSVAKAKSEAKHFLRMIGEALDACGGELRHFVYPVYYDLEPNGRLEKCSRQLIGDMAEAFISDVKAAGYKKAGVYADKERFTKLLTDPRFDQWPRWVAQYYTSCTLQKPFEGWQRSSTGNVAGIIGNVDLDEFYVDYAAGAAAEPVDTKQLPDLTGYVGRSISGALNGVGYPSDYVYRRDVLAPKLGMVGYAGTEQQNLDMIVKLGGKLKEDPAEQHIVYVVKKGDTLSAIARKHKTTVAAILQMNHIPDKNLIYVGQKITVS